MPTTSDYLTQLQQDREDLVDNLETQGIDDLTGDETFTELVPRVLDIEGGGTEPEKGIFPIEYDNDGFPIKFKVKNMQIPMSFFEVANPNDNVLNGLGSFLKYVQEITITQPTTENITAIPSLAFCNCNGLTTLNLPNTITDFNNYAFYKCPNLALNLDNFTITSIGEKTVGSQYSTGNTFFNCSSLLCSSLDNDVIITGNSNFTGCSSITLSIIPTSWTIIPDSTFQGCSSIPTMDLSNITEIGQYAFENCTNLTSVTSTALKTIKQSAFNGCTKLESFQFPSTLTALANNAFKTTKLSKILLDTTSSLSVPNSCFHSCTSITHALLSNITGIAGTSSSNNGFGNCTALSKVWIGSSATSSGMSRYAFYGCNNLTTIYIDLPRATVQAFTNYQYAFMNNTNKTGIIICNDDNDFISKTSFQSLYFS